MSGVTLITEPHGVERGLTLGCLGYGLLRLGLCLGSGLSFGLAYFGICFGWHLSYFFGYYFDMLPSWTCLVFKLC